MENAQDLTRNIENKLNGDDTQLLDRDIKFFSVVSGRDLNKRYQKNYEIL